jgi:hypothetical protein
MKTCVRVWQYLAHFLLEWEMFRSKFGEEIKNMHFVFSDFFFFENHSLYEIMWKKYCTDTQATDDNTAHVHWILDT